MKKKTIAIVAVLLLAVTMVSASPFKFVFGDAGQHKEVLYGFCPTYVFLGAGYDGLTLIDGNTTSIQLLLGGGYRQRQLWQNPDGTRLANRDSIVYDVALADWALRFEQGFLDSNVGDKDLITVGLQYEGRFELARDAINWSSHKDYGILNDKLATGDYSTIYPDLRGDHRFLATSFGFYAKFDMMDDRKTSSDGFLARFDAKWSPSALNGALDGRASFYSLTLNLVGAYTIYQIPMGNDGKSWFAITLVDRANINWTDGSAVPMYHQGIVSLGRKVRGYSNWTYNTQFSVVNNFDVRFSGPDMGIKGIFPRINLFFDMGYGTGKYFNCDISSGNGNFLCSTGAEFTISFFDFIDLGYQVAYLISGEKYANAEGNRLATKFTFFLDF